MRVLLNELIGYLEQLLSVLLLCCLGLATAYLFLLFVQVGSLFVQFVCPALEGIQQSCDIMLTYVGDTHHHSLAIPRKVVHAISFLLKRCLQCPALNRCILTADSYTLFMNCIEKIFSLLHLWIAFFSFSVDCGS